MDLLTGAHRRFSTLILAALVWLIPAISSAATGSADKLQILVNDTAAQLQLAYRRHPDERIRRQEQLTAAVAAWRVAPRSEANNERLAHWLRAAILSSMPGSQDPLPAVPSFAVVIRDEPQPDVHKPNEVPSEPKKAEIAIGKKTPVKLTAKPEPDPFRDDPVSISE
jgi:hypothetical protein